MAETSPMDNFDSIPDNDFEKISAPGSGSDQEGDGLQAAGAVDEPQDGEVSTTTAPATAADSNTGEDVAEEDQFNIIGASEVEGFSNSADPLVSLDEIDPQFQLQAQSEAEADSHFQQHSPQDVEQDPHINSELEDRNNSMPEQEQVIEPEQVEPEQLSPVEHEVPEQLSAVEQPENDKPESPVAQPEIEEPEQLSAVEQPEQEEHELLSAVGQQEQEEPEQLSAVTQPEHEEPEHLSSIQQSEPEEPGMNTETDQHIDFSEPEQVLDSEPEQVVESEFEQVLESEPDPLLGLSSEAEPKFHSDDPLLPDLQDGLAEEGHGIVDELVDATPTSTSAVESFDPLVEPSAPSLEPENNEPLVDFDSSSGPDIMSVGVVAASASQPSNNIPDPILTPENVVDSIPQNESIPSEIEKDVIEASEVSETSQKQEDEGKISASVFQVASSALKLIILMLPCRYIW